MKKIIVSLFVISAICGFALAQSKLPELEKTKKIKFLESTRKDVKRILAGYKADDKDVESFTTENAKIVISYTEKEECFNNDSDQILKWNVSEGRVKFIKITPEKWLEFEHLNINVSNYKKEQIYENVKD